MNAIFVPLVDDNLTFLRIAACLLQEQSDVVVVGTAGGGEEVLAQGQGLQPDIVLGDLAMPGLSGLKCVSENSKHALRAVFSPRGASLSQCGTYGF
ncbi:MAG: response regulator [Anaerolineae bacterium]|nr:response regulator [Anaerolineae bacterium]